MYYMVPSMTSVSLYMLNYVRVSAYSIICGNTLQLIYLYLLHLLSTRKLQNPHLMLVRLKCTKYYNQLITPMLPCTQTTIWASNPLPGNRYTCRHHHMLPTKHHQPNHVK